MSTLEQSASLEQAARATDEDGFLTEISRRAKREERRLAIQSPFLHKMQFRHFLFYNVGPLVGTIAAIALAFKEPIGLMEISLFLAFWLATGLGISAGYHRLLCHRSFQAAKPVRALLAIFGCMAAQGPAVSWVAMHRRHHEIADMEGDVHSPNLHGSDMMGRIKGFIHAHFTWMIRHDYPNVVHYVPDLLQEPMLLRISRLYNVWIFLGLALPAAIGGLITGTVMGAVQGFLWGGIVRMFVVGHSISALNSVLHTIGTKRFRTRGHPDNSRNNWLVGLLVWGEGWHNNHHSFPYSASFALAWHKIDLSYWLIKLLEAVGLAWDVKVPTKEQIAKRTVEISVDTAIRAN